MKLKLIVFILFQYSISIGHAQCNCETIDRFDGTKVTQCPPLPVAHNSKMEVGFSVASNGESEFAAITIRFQVRAQNITSNLSVRLDDNKMIQLELIDSQLSYIGGSQVTNAVFAISESNKASLKASKLKTISFKLEDNLLYTEEATLNEDVLRKQLNCLD